MQQLNSERPAPATGTGLDSDEQAVQSKPDKLSVYASAASAASVLGVQAVFVLGAKPATATGSAITSFLVLYAKQDIYFLLGEAKYQLAKKPRKDDMAGSRRLWVDLDPPASVWDKKSKQEIGSGSLDRWRSATLAALRAFDPAPTFVIDSGRGFWGLWQLDALALQDDVEAANIALARAFGDEGDKCHNIDRVARMPDTLNTKTGARSRLVVCEPERVYSIDQFAKATVTAKTAIAPARAAVAAKTSGKAAASDPIAALAQYGISPTTLAIIASGHDPSDPARFPSRSEAVWYVCCELCRRTVPEQIVLAVLLDKRLGISESIYVQSDGTSVSQPDRYAQEQITKAQAEVGQDGGGLSELDELNAKHAVLLQEGGKTRVLSWEKSELDFSKEVPVLQSFNDFRNRYMHRRVPVETKDGLKLIPLGQWWLGQERRRQFTALRFLPGQPEEIDGYLNLWRGFSVAPEAGSWARMRGHVHEVLAAGDATHADYILRWAAWTAQNPDQPAEVALVLKGGRGTGKGTFARALKRLFGQHGLQVTSPMQLTGRFNAHLRDCCLLFADEAIAPGDKASESVLKGLITEPELTIEGKGVNAVQARNRLHIIMASNESWVVPAGIDERRFAVFEVSKARSQSKEYFEAIETEWRNGGHAAMLHDLLTFDLGHWHPRHEIPKTDALKEQQAHSLSGFEALFLDLLRAGQLPTRRDVGPGQPFVATSDLRDYAQERLRRDVSFNAVSKLLSDLGFEQPPHERPRGFALPTLPQARQAWDKAKSAVPWDSTEEWASIGAEAPKGPTPF